MKICKFSVNKIKKIIGWSHGYENLVLDWKKPNFTWSLWIKMANKMARFVNAIRFFAYCTEDASWLEKTVVPCKKLANGKYDCSQLDGNYVSRVKERLNEYHKRKLTTMICLFTSIKGQRFQFCPFHGDRNAYPTTKDHTQFMRHKETIKQSMDYVRAMVRKFDNEYIIWELINEPFTFKRGEMVKWYNRMVKLLNKLGVPNDRIMVEFVGNLGSGIFQYLDAGIWSATHGNNSLEIIQRFHKTNERWGLREDKETGAPRYMTASGDGGDEFVKRGLKIWGGGEGNRKASSKQMNQMIKFDLSHGKIPQRWHLTSGHGIEFMSNSAFAMPFDKYYTNLTDAIKIGTKGLSAHDCEILGVDYKENKKPELKAIFRGYRSSK